MVYKKLCTFKFSNLDKTNNFLKGTNYTNSIKKS